MAKKIKVSTVKQLADVEVIFLNASFVWKAMEAKHVLSGAIQGLRFSDGGRLPTEEISEVENHVLAFLDELNDAILDAESDEKTKEA